MQLPDTGSHNREPQSQAAENKNWITTTLTEAKQQLQALGTARLLQRPQSSSENNSWIPKTPTILRGKTAVRGCRNSLITTTTTILRGKTTVTAVENKSQIISVGEG